MLFWICQQLIGMVLDTFLKMVSFEEFLYVLLVKSIPVQHICLLSNSSPISSFLQVAAEVAAPLSQTRKVTMVSSGKGDVGAEKLTGEVMDIMNRLPQLVQTMTGVDIAKVRKNLKI